MAEVNENKPRRRRIRHTDRGNQVFIYLGKQFRFFINENDWKVLPMAAIIAALVGMVIRSNFFVNMEGCLFGGFALTCVAIWNGCFNSIQAVCRERAIIKREHRSGMHISSYVTAHMIYQFLLCLAQTLLTVYVLLLMGIQFPAKGLFTPWMMLDMAISLLLITYAADMMSLLISSFSRTTTGAMTVMPFVLIFQLVFSGGLIPLPEWSQPISNFTISSYGIKVLTAQTDYNNRPMVTGWKTLRDMRNVSVGGTFSVGQLLDLVNSPAVEKTRDRVILKSMTVGDVLDYFAAAERVVHLRDRDVVRPFTIRSAVELILREDAFKDIRTAPFSQEENALTLEGILNMILAEDGMQPLLDTEVGETVTVGQVMDFLRVDEFLASIEGVRLNGDITVGDVADFVKNSPLLQANRDRSVTIRATVGTVIDLFGEENVKALVEERTAVAGRNPEYDLNKPAIVRYWLMLGAFILGFAILSVIVLEFIDRDKR